jgi:hypothetical protein
MEEKILETDRYPLKDKRSDEERQKQLFESIRKNVEKGMTEEQISNLKVLGEKFHESFDVTRGTTHDMNEICMEEALAYVVESLKSGIHPAFLNEDEKAILQAGYGEKWYEQWGYTSDKLDGEEE